MTRLKATVALWWLLRRRARGAAGDSEPARLTTALAVVAFATTTAILLVVVGGFMAFVARAGGSTGIAEGLDADTTSYTTQYPLYAGIASLLLVVPLATLGGAAARLAAARRDARLASLRLAGATTGQVTLLAALDAGAQALVGAAFGVGAYLALLPLVAQLRFQGRTFDLGELWVGPWVVLAALAGVVLVALVSALVSLRRVAITPLGVAARVTPPGLRWTRLLPFLFAGLAMVVAVNTSWASEAIVIAVLTTVLVGGFATLNVIGPFVMSLAGRVTAGRARRVPALLAGRRIVDSPKTAWRSVGGVALATFVAGLTSIFALIDPSDQAPADRVLLTDLKTGGFLTLAIAGVLAAVSTGVLQAGRVIDQRSEYRALRLAGTDERTLDRARLDETLVPLLVAVGVATIAALMLMLPVLGVTALANVAVVAQFLACVLAASLLVLAAAWTTRRIAHTLA
ncbi:FtsX-like permease family protein [Luteimicrobium sp. DT211]|uniref:FtsX-like permease family protein n=1 Tax=Luteimicrobium sp. DT211 TaxID=3393412 RepID=UPI003CEE6424